MSGQEQLKSTSIHASREAIEIPPSKWHRVLVAMRDSVARAFVSDGKTEKEANSDAVIAVRAIFEDFRGCMVYIPSLAASERAIRHMLIWSEFDGTNVEALAKKHRFSVQHVYRVIKQHRELGKGR